MVSKFQEYQRWSCTFLHTHQIVPMVLLRIYNLNYLHKDYSNFGVSVTHRFISIKFLIVPI